MVAHSKALWEDVRLAYEHSDEPVDSIGRRFGIARGTIIKKARAAGWEMRSERGSIAEQPRDVMVRRLFRTIDLKLAQLEARMAHDDEISAADHERETRALGQLIRNFEKVTGLEGEQRDGARPGRGGKSDPSARGADGDDPHRLREELAERILRLRERRPGGEG